MLCWSFDLNISTSVALCNVNMIKPGNNEAQACTSRFLGLTDTVLACHLGITVRYSSLVALVPVFIRVRSECWQRSHTSGSPHYAMDD